MTSFTRIEISSSDKNLVTGYDDLTDMHDNREKVWLQESKVSNDGHNYIYNIYKMMDYK